MTSDKRYRGDARHVLWDKWTKADAGQHRLAGRLFSDRGQIYHGCTAFDAATDTLDRLNLLGGELRSGPPVPADSAARPLES